MDIAYPIMPCSGMYPVFVPHAPLFHAVPPAGPPLIMGPIPYPKPVFYPTPMAIRFFVPPPVHQFQVPMNCSFVQTTLAPPSGMPRYSYYDYLVVVDFEATCHDNRGSPHEVRPLRVNERPEIIQFPAVLINVRTARIVDTFNTFVRPVEQPILSSFCTELTGITQEQVDNAPTFPEALELFEQWLAKYRLNKFSMGRTFAIVTDGSYDIGHFLYKQCVISGIPFPEYAHNWVDVRHSFRKYLGRHWHSLRSALKYIGYEFEGRHHNGLDDAKNIARIALRLLTGGAVFTASSKMVFDPEEQLLIERLILNNKFAKKYELATVKSVSIGECLYFVSPGVIAGVVPSNSIEDYPFAERLVEVSEYESIQAPKESPLAQQDGNKKTENKKTQTSVEKRVSPNSSKSRVVSGASVAEE